MQQQMVWPRDMPAGCEFFAGKVGNTIIYLRCCTAADKAALKMSSGSACSPQAASRTHTTVR
jgi:hypothetical protein